jgi:voltage-gated potassium channel
MIINISSTGKNMKRLNSEHAQTVRNVLHSFGVLAAILLIMSISLEAFSDDSFAQHTIYFEVQFWICVYFTADFFVFLLLAEKKWVFFRRYCAALLISIPYLSLIDYEHLQLSPEQSYFVRLIPLIRGAVALVFVVTLIVRRNTTALFLSYLILLASIVYFTTLLFFVVERGVNPEVKTYYDSLWWAAMTVTTVGSNILPVTAAGKIITTVLAIVGLTIFPILTAYITTIINRIGQREIAEARKAKLSNQHPAAAE